MTAVTSVERQPLESGLVRSLTIAALESSTFDVQLVPHTLMYTNLHARGIDDPVNLECDMIGKYVARAMELMGKAAV